MNYPGHIIQQGEHNAAIVTAVQQQLNTKGCGPITVDGDYGEKTTHAVQLFQTRFHDPNGNSLKMDGVIGPVTWAALFGTDTVSTITAAPNELLTEVLRIAAGKIGVLEVPPGSNNGRDVNMFQDAAGVPHGLPWCMAFVYWCFNQAAASKGRANPMVRTGSVLDQWRRTNGTKIMAANAQQNTSLVQPGQVFIISTGGGAGHTGFVEKIENGMLTTIEGNTNDGGSREGIGVFRRARRTINSINEGFIQFS